MKKTIMALALAATAQPATAAVFDYIAPVAGATYTPGEPSGPPTVALTLAVADADVTAGAVEVGAVCSGATCSPATPGFSIAGIYPDPTYDYAATSFYNLSGTIRFAGGNISSATLEFHIVVDGGLGPDCDFFIKDLPNAFGYVGLLAHNYSGFISYILPGAWVRQGEGVSAVSEPGAIGVMLAGFLGIAAVRRRWV